MDGQADSAPGSEGLADLAAFLADTPEEESAEENEATAEETTAEGDPEPEQTDGQDEPEEAEAKAEEEPEEEAEPAPERKIKVQVKADDGTETTQEVPESELVKGYQRQADYTRKTQALAERESQAVELLKTKHDEVRNQYISQAELQRAAVVQMAGLKTEQEMAVLASTDPAAWVQENQRRTQIGNFLSQLDQQIQGEKQKAQAEQEARFKESMSKQFQQTWSELEKLKIDKPTLAKIYGEVNKTYGFSNEELGNVYDHRLVKMMKDATAYRALQAQKKDVVQKATDAPRMPNRQATPAQERKSRELDAKFKSGRAKLNDLASYLA